MENPEENATMKRWAEEGKALVLTGQKSGQGSKRRRLAGGSESSETTR